MKERRSLIQHGRRRSELSGPKSCCPLAIWKSAVTNADQGDLSRRVNFIFRILLFYTCFCESAWWGTLWVVHRVWHKVWRGLVLYELGGCLLGLCVAVRQLRAAIH